MSNNLFFNHHLPSGLTVVTPPSSEPVTVAEAKLWARIEDDFTTDDDLISGLITSARIFAETYQKRTLITTEYRYVVDGFPGLPMRGSMPVLFLPMPRLQAEDSSDIEIVYTGIDGNATTLDPSRYVVDVVSQPGRVTPVFGQPWPPLVRPNLAAVQVTYTAGYEDADAVPESTKTAIKLLVSHWYRNREATGTATGETAFAVKTLLDADAVGSLY